MRKFNVTGRCVPEEDYMVDISSKLKQIISLVDRRYYFTINRARQYGKTTTLYSLTKALSSDYTCINLSFEGVGDTMFESPASFCQNFLIIISKTLESTDKDFAAAWLDESVTNFILLGFHLDKLCQDRKIVLLIDEVDKTSNNQVFLHFLGMLRSKYLSRGNGYSFTFHSVILAGVYDIKNIKSKMISEGKYKHAGEEGNIYNSPWNIAVNFKVDMSFSPAEIATMLKEYDTEHNTGMEIGEISDEIYTFTSGYPFLVSRVCQAIDEELDKNWTQVGVRNAVKMLYKEKNTLFDDIGKNLENNKDLYDLIYDILILGRNRTYTTINPTVEMASMYGFIKETEQGIAVANKIFENVICTYFISKDEGSPNKRIEVVQLNDVLKNGRFDMELCLRKFATHFAKLFNENDYQFLEVHGKKVFLAYLIPLINGQGFYHLESQLADLRRMDIVVDFGRDQFIIEIKIWYGESKHQEAYEQLLGYMDSNNAQAGYLLTYDFRNEANKQRRAEWVDFDDGKRIFDVVL